VVNALHPHPVVCLIHLTCLMGEDMEARHQVSPVRTRRLPRNINVLKFRLGIPPFLILSLNLEIAPRNSRTLTTVLCGGLFVCLFHLRLFGV
jgi:hypothetical protein